MLLYLLKKLKLITIIIMESKLIKLKASGGGIILGHKSQTPYKRKVETLISNLIEYIKKYKETRKQIYAEKIIFYKNEEKEIDIKKWIDDLVKHRLLEKVGSYHKLEEREDIHLIAYMRLLERIYKNLNVSRSNYKMVLGYIKTTVVNGVVDEEVRNIIERAINIKPIYEGEDDVYEMLNKMENPKTPTISTFYLHKDPEEVIIDKEVKLIKKKIRKHLDDALNQLTDKQRKVIEDYYFHRKNKNTIASEEGITIEGVRSRENQLKRILTQDSFSESEYKEVI